MRLQWPNPRHVQRPEPIELGDELCEAADGVVGEDVLADVEVHGLLELAVGL